METASVESSRTEASRVGGLGAKSERLGGVKGLTEAGHASTSVSHIVRGVQEGLTSLTSISEGESHQQGVQEGLIDLATKQGDEFGVAGWRRVGGCVASSRSLRRD